MKGVYSNLRSRTRPIAANWHPFSPAGKRDKWQAWRPQLRPPARSSDTDAKA